MADDSSKPNVLICGGVNTYSRALAAYLVPLDGEPLVSHLRIVDKYSVEPATTYIGSEFPQVLNKPQVDYKQANLTVQSIVESVFEPPTGQRPYDYVFDLSGEVRYDRTEMIQINTTHNVARMLGQEAAKRNVKAYVRVTLPFYETSSKGSHDEKDDPKPDGTIGIWWHETLRTLAAIDNLNLVILRAGFVYGPYVEFGDITSAITVASVYGYLKKPMKSVWSPGKNPTNTLHVVDLAGAAWASAQWMASLGRKEADILAGESIIFHNEKAKVSQVTGMQPHDKRLVAPLFNIVDDSKSTLLSVGQTVTSFFGTTFDFFNFAERNLYKFMDDTVEEINEQHVGGWTEMIQSSDPPVLKTPLSAYMDKYALEKHVVEFNNTKIKEIIGYTLKYSQFNHDAIRDTVGKWKEEGSWPTVV